MTDASAAIEQAQQEAPRKSKGLLFGLIGAVALGGAAFFGVFSGMIPLPFGNSGDQMEHVGPDGVHAVKDAAADSQSESSAGYVPMRELIISLGPNSQAKHLKLVMTIEVTNEAEEQIIALAPRIRDVLNTFLRAVDERDFEVPRAMARLRGQMLRRVQLVTPPGAVRDLLIQDFVLN